MRWPAAARWRGVALGTAALLVLSGCGRSWEDQAPSTPVTELLGEQQSGGAPQGSSRHRLAILLTTAHDERGEPYDWGADGPEVWDCSSFVRHAYAAVSIRMPRTARAQRDWMAEGNGVAIRPGREQPGDLVFWDDYRGPDEIGHVAMVWDPDTTRSIEARPPQTGFYDYDGAQDNNRFEIWRATEFDGPLAGG
ncbi:MAG: NlpC/P60 family protein [Ornithinimicrobium sp.]